MELKQPSLLSKIGSACSDVRSILLLAGCLFLAGSTTVVAAKRYVDNKNVDLEKRIDRKFAILNEILRESGPNFKEAVDKVNDKYDNQKQFLGVISYENQ